MSWNYIVNINHEYELFVLYGTSEGGFGNVSELQDWLRTHRLDKDCLTILVLTINSAHFSCINIVISMFTVKALEIVRNYGRDNLIYM